MNIPIVSLEVSSRSSVIHPSFYLIHIHLLISLYGLFWFLGFNITRIIHYTPSSCRRPEKPWVQPSKPYKLNVVEHTCNPSIGRAGGSEVHGQPHYTVWGQPGTHETILKSPNQPNNPHPHVIFLFIWFKFFHLTQWFWDLSMFLLPGLVLWCCCVIS